MFNKRNKKKLAELEDQLLWIKALLDVAARYHEEYSFYLNTSNQEDESHLESAAYSNMWKYEAIKLQLEEAQAELTKLKKKFIR